MVGEAISRRSFLALSLAAALGCAMPAPLDKKYDAALELFKQGDYQGARGLLNEIIDVDRTHAGAYSNRGLCHLALGDLARAVQDFSRAVTIKPDFPAPYVYRGRINRHIGATYRHAGMEEARARECLESAHKDFEVATSLDENNPDAYAGLGFAYLALGNEQKAFYAFERVVELIKEGRPVQRHPRLLPIPERAVRQEYERLKPKYRRDM
jgi:tetratricopeptide (TPR) repeat protein